jgi:quinol-cytochrome oxidoreductase complex cytochrome b subunit
MTDWVLIVIAAIACYAFVAYLEHKKKLDLIDRGLWKPEEKQEKPEHKLITGLFFFLLGVALLIGSCLPGVEPDLVGGLRISGLLTTAAGMALLIAYAICKKTLTPV